METEAGADALIIALEGGDVVIDLLPEVAPLHVERVTTLAEAGAYDNVAFHRVLEGFVAQTGDVQFGDLEDGYDPELVGRGGSTLPDLPAEFSDIAFERAVVGMARASDPDSANSQFFITLEPARFLDGEFTVFGAVVGGMELVDGIKLGDRGNNGAVTDPDRMFDVGVDELTAGDGVSASEAQTIALLFEASFGRQAGYAGLNFWIDGLEGGRPMERIAQDFIDSPEFTAVSGDPDSLDDPAFIDALFDNVIGRPPAQPGLDFWVGELDVKSRAQVLIDFATAPENVAQSPAVLTVAQIGDGDGPDRDPNDALRQDFEPEWDFVG